MNLMIVPGMLVSSSFLISMCMFIVSKALLIPSATVIVRAVGGGDIWLNPLCYGVAYCVLCRHCRVLCFVPVLRVCLYCLRLCKEEGSSPVSLQLLRRGIWACMRGPCLYLCWVLGWGLC